MVFNWSRLWTSCFSFCMLLSSVLAVCHSILLKFWFSIFVVFSSGRWHSAAMSSLAAWMTCSISCSLVLSVLSIEWNFCSSICCMSVLCPEDSLDICSDCHGWIDRLCRCRCMCWLLRCVPRGRLGRALTPHQLLRAVLLTRETPGKKSGATRTYPKCVNPHSPCSCRDIKLR